MTHPSHHRAHSLHARNFFHKLVGGVDGFLHVLLIGFVKGSFDTLVPSGALPRSLACTLGTSSLGMHPLSSYGMLGGVQTIVVGNRNHVAAVLETCMGWVCLRAEVL